MRALILMLGFCLSPAALACTCGVPSVSRAFDRSTIVFVGEVQGGSERFSYDDRGETVQLETGNVRLTVEELFKGSSSKEVVLALESDTRSSCLYGLRRGERYLVYAHSTPTDPTKLYTSLCSRNRRFDDREVHADVEFLRNLPPPGVGGKLLGQLLRYMPERRRGLPLANIPIEIRSKDGRVIRAASDRAGQFELAGLRPGVYRVVAQAPPQYRIDPVEVQVVDRGREYVDLVAFTH